MISIIIRARNEEQYLGEVIRAILAQDEPEDFETLVLDSGSTDRTLEIARALPVRVEQMPAGSFTFGRALNLGIRLTQGRMIVYLSAHCTPTSHAWLRELVTPLRQDSALAATYGRQEPRPGINPFEEGGLYKAFPADSSRFPAALFSNANCAIWRHVLEARPFDETLEFAEDLVWRLQFNPQQIRYVPTASVYHTHPLNLRYWSRRFRSDAVATLRMKHTYGINNPYVRLNTGVHGVVRDFLGGIVHQLRYFGARRYYRMMPVIPVFEGMRVLSFARGAAEGRKLVTKTKAKSQVRWVKAQPGTGLTWGKQISGDPFITKVDQYAKFSPEKLVLEIGPGYGRLIQSLIHKKLLFSEYYAIDLSENNCLYLRQTFPDAKLHFLHDSAESVKLPKAFDIMYSSLTFKHLYPSFEAVLQSIAKQGNPGAVLVFDLLEGQRASYFEEDGVTFIHHYTREEVKKIAGDAQLVVSGFDYVEHDPENPERTRLVVVARKT